jgi:hypothetical protein
MTHLVQRRWIWGLLFGMGSILAAVWLNRPSSVERAIKALRQEGIPTNPVELDAWYPHLPVEENAALGVLNAISLFQELPEGPSVAAVVQPSKSVTNRLSDQALTDYYRRYLATNGDAYGALHEALQHPRARYPVNFTTGWQTLLPHLGILKLTSNRLRLAAEAGLGFRDERSVVGRLVDQVRLAQTLEKEPALISEQVALVMGSIAVQTAEVVLARDQLGEGELMQLQGVYLEAAQRVTYEPGMVGEFCEILGTLSLSPRALARTPYLSGGGRASGGWDPRADIVSLGYSLSGWRGRDLGTAIQVVDPLRRAARLPPVERVQEIRRLQALLPERFLSPLEDVSSNIVPFIRETPMLCLHQSTEFYAAGVSCAVERWRRANVGKLPESLDDLVPKYLAALPIDPMNGKSLKYRRFSDGYVVYGVGEDGSDHGGERKAFIRGEAAGRDYPFTVRYGRK